MAISTYKVFLMKKADTGEQWSKLIDIKEFPDLGGEPEMLETTTLSDNIWIRSHRFLSDTVICFPRVRSSG